jgi:hypothetical protein
LFVTSSSLPSSPHACMSLCVVCANNQGSTTIPLSFLLPVNPLARNPTRRLGKRAFACFAQTDTHRCLRSIDTSWTWLHKTIVAIHSQSKNTHLFARKGGNLRRAFPKQTWRGGGKKKKIFEKLDRGFSKCNLVRIELAKPCRSFLCVRDESFVCH